MQSPCFHSFPGAARRHERLRRKKAAWKGRPTFPLPSLTVGLLHTSPLRRVFRCVFMQ